MIVRELLAKLGFNVDTAKVDAWEKRVKVAKATMNEASGAAKDLAKFAAKVTVAMAAAGGAVIGMVTRTAAKFETLNASLKTVTGSTAAASAAFDTIRKLAADTPFSVEQLTQSFIKLKALGLDASKESLISYGNTAAAMGKGLDQMIEAVADAATGEFERLKEFGIKSKSEGDRVTFTFQGISTTVGKNADEITGYLRGIGDNNFAGAMSEQMDTFNGIMSNIKDNLDAFLMQVGKEGLLDAMKEVGKEIRDMTGGGGNLAKTLGRTLAMAVRSTWKILKDGIPLVLSLVEAFSSLLDFFGGPTGLIIALTAGKAAMMSFSLAMQAMQAGSAAASTALRGISLAAGAVSVALAAASLAVAYYEKKILDLKSAAAAINSDASEKLRNDVSGYNDSQLKTTEMDLAREVAKQERDKEGRSLSQEQIVAMAKGGAMGIGTHPKEWGDIEESKLGQLKADLAFVREEDTRRTNAGAERESALGSGDLSKVASGEAVAVATKSPQQLFLAKARAKGAKIGATDLAIDAAREKFQKLLTTGSSRAVAEAKAMKVLRSMSSTGGGGRKKKTKEEKTEIDGLSADDMLEKDFGGGLGSPIKGVRPTLGTTINKIDNSYAPKLDVKIEVAQQPGEDSGMLAGRVAEAVRKVLGGEIRRAVDHFQGAVTG